MSATDNLLFVEKSHSAKEKHGDQHPKGIGPTPSTRVENHCTPSSIDKNEHKMYEIICLGEVIFTKECLLWSLSIRKGEGRKVQKMSIKRAG
jgi:hypothetical protein